MLHRGEEMRVSNPAILRATASLVDTISLPRGGELVRQAIQHAEHSLHAVAG